MTDGELIRQTIDRSTNQPVWFTEDPKSRTQPSEYTNNYVRHPILPPLPANRSRLDALQPTQIYNQDIGTSEHRDKYSELFLANQRHCRRKDQIGLSKERMTKTTCYNKDFVASDFKKAFTHPPPPATIVLGEDSEFANRTIYRDDFKKFDSDKIKRPIPDSFKAKEKLPVPMTLGIDKASEETQSKEIPKPKSLETAFQLERTLGGRTEYSGNYHLWDTVRTPGIAPIYRKPKDPFIGRTSYNDEFVKKDGKPALSCNPLQSELKMEGPFSGLSLYKESFVPKPIDMSDKNIYTNNDSVMYNTGPTDWWLYVPSVPFIENKAQIFYKS